MDHLHPVIINHASKGNNWAENGVHLIQILKRNEITGEGSEEPLKYSNEKLIKKKKKKGNIKED